MRTEYRVLQHGYTKCPQAWGIVDESALFYRLYFVYGGEAYYQKDGEKKPLKKGHFYIFPQMSLYTLQHDPKEPLEVLWFHLELNPMVYQKIEEINIEDNPLLKVFKETLYHLSQDVQFITQMEEVLKSFLEVINTQKSTYECRDLKMEEVLDYIHKHIEVPLSISQIAKNVGMERSYFSRKFKARFNMSPREYIFAKKMSEATKALVKGVSVKEASYLVGYEDEKAFARAFKSYMEVSPSEYKKSHIEQP